MKKRFVLVLSVIFLLSMCFPMSAFADEAAPVDNLQKAGITPDNFLGYNIDKLMEVIQEVLTLSPEDKASLQQKLSEERLAEAKVMIEKKKDKLAAETLKAYAKKAEEALENTEKASDNGADVDSTITRMEDIKRIARIIVDNALTQAAISVTTPSAISIITPGAISAELDAQEIRLVYVKAMVELNKELNQARKAVKALKQSKESADNSLKLNDAIQQYDYLKSLRDGFREIKQTINNVNEDVAEDTGNLTENTEKLQAIVEKIEKLSDKGNGKAAEKIREHFKQAINNIGAKLEEASNDSENSPATEPQNDENQDDDEDDKQVKQDKDTKSDKGNSAAAKGNNKK